MNNLEIERKFIFNESNHPLNDFILSLESVVKYDIKQGYLFNENGKIMRIRIIDEKTAYLTYKRNLNVLTRVEVEDEINLEFGNSLFEECEHVLRKTRYDFEHNGLKWSLDVFKDKLQGLVMLEIELSNEKQQIEIPSFCGVEVTDDLNYTNSELSMKD